MGVHIFPELAFLCAVVLHTAFGRTPLAVRIFAPKRATEILTAGVTWMGQEENPAMPAAHQISLEAGLGSQNGPENEIVLQREIPDLALTVPARPKLKMFLDFCDQKPSVSLMILMCFCTASSYTIGTPCVER